MATPDICTYDDYRLFLRDRRVALGLSVRAVSTHTGIPGETWIHQVEQNIRVLRDSHIEKIAPILELTEGECVVLRLLLLKSTIDQSEYLDHEINIAKAKLRSIGMKPQLSLLSSMPIDQKNIEQYIFFKQKASYILDTYSQTSERASKFLGISQATNTTGIENLSNTLKTLAFVLSDMTETSFESCNHVALLEMFPLSQSLCGSAYRSTSVDVPTIYTYPSGIAFLRDWLGERSVRWLANEIGHDHSMITRSLKNGKISKRMADSLCSFWLKTGEFTQTDEHFFRTLLARDNATIEQIKCLDEELAILRSNSDLMELKDYSSDVLGDWRCAAVVDLPQCMSIGLDYEVIGAALEPTISAKEAEDVVTKLRQAKMLKVVRDSTSNNIFLTSKPYPLWLKRKAESGTIELAFFANLQAMHKESLRRIRNLNNTHHIPSATNFHCIPLNFSKKDTLKFTKILEEYQTSIAKRLGGQITDANRVMQINLHLFPTNVS